MAYHTLPISILKIWLEHISVSILPCSDPRSSEPSLIDKECALRTDNQPLCRPKNSVAGLKIKQRFPYLKFYIFFSQSMLWNKNKYTPVYHSFTTLQWGLRGVHITWTCFLDGLS